MNAITSLSARQLRRAAEIKEEMQSLAGELHRIANSPEGDGVHIFPKRRGRLRQALKRGIFAVAGPRLVNTGERTIVFPARRLKHQFSSATKAKIADTVRSRWKRMNDIDIT